MSHCVKSLFYENQILMYFGSAEVISLEKMTVFCYIGNYCSYGIGENSLKIVRSIPDVFQTTSDKVIIYLNPKCTTVLP